jgi:hypothetical protein
MYRLGENTGTGRWPYIANGHAFLADGTPLTERGETGRIVPAMPALERLRNDCSDGRLRLADRQAGMEALARALDRKDMVRAPILLLQLQIDEVARLSKYNPFHKPHGPGAGQFASGPSSGGAIHPVEWDMHVGVNSTYQPGVFGPDMDAAHDKVMEAVRKAILDIGDLKIRPGVPGYGQLLHKAIALELLKLNDPDLRPNEIYLHGNLVGPGAILEGSSVPDTVYAPGGVPKIIFEYKSGRATNTQDPGNVRQKDNALRNVPNAPLYEYIQVYEKFAE